MTVRPHRVEALMIAANEGMRLAVTTDDTPQEVLSAYLSLAATAIRVALHMGADRRKVRDAVEQLLLRVPPENDRVN